MVVDATGDLVKAARDIVDGASFDNSLPCTAEKELIAVDVIADLLRFEMAKVGAHELTNPDELRALENLVLNERRRPRTEWIGRDATAILDAIGVT